MESDLKRAKSDIGILNDFLKLLKSTWSDDVNRIVGWVDWAPKITNKVDPHHYTRDIGVVTLYEDKFIKNFKGNFVYLGPFSSYLSFFLSSSNGNMILQLVSSPTTRLSPASTRTPPTRPNSSTRKTIYLGYWVSSTLQPSRTRTSSTRIITLASPLPRMGRPLILPLVASPSSRRTPAVISRTMPGRSRSSTGGAGSTVISPLWVTLAQLSSMRRASWSPSCTPACPVAYRTMLPLEPLVTTSSSSSRSSTPMPISPAQSLLTTTKPLPSLQVLFVLFCLHHHRHDYVLSNIESPNI